jgi:hypothetical protein
VAGGRVFRGLGGGDDRDVGDVLRVENLFPNPETQVSAA